MAACMMRTASFWSLTEPMCQPPRARIETRTPVLPSGRVGRPAALSAASTAPAKPAAAPAARVECRNSRRVLVGSDMVGLRECEEIILACKPCAGLPARRPGVPTRRVTGRPARGPWRLVQLEGRCLPTVITVTGTGDTVAVDGLVTLREAILAANTDQPVGDAPAGSGTDTIRFAM